MFFFISSFVLEETSRRRVVHITEIFDYYSQNIVVGETRYARLIKPICPPVQWVKAHAPV